MARLDTQYSSKSAVQLKVSSFEPIWACLVISQLEVLTQMSTTACSWISPKLHWLDISNTYDTYSDDLRTMGHWRTRSFTGIPAALFVIFHKKKTLSMVNTRHTQMPLSACIMTRPWGSTSRAKTGRCNMRSKGGTNGTLSGALQLVWSQTEPCWCTAERQKK